MKYDVVIIGGNPAGGATAMSAKMLHKDKSVLIIKKEPKSLVPCGIPYTFGTLKNIDDNVIDPERIKKGGMDLLIDEVTAIDIDNKQINLKGSEPVSYDKLIVATGSEPFVPPILGADLEGVVTIRKELEYIKTIQPKLKQAENVVVVGAGFIGVEMSDELSKVCKNVTLIESMDSILPLAFDNEIAEPAVSVLQNHGVNIRTNTMVDKIVGENGKVRAVKLKSGEEIKADHVILAIGYRSNVALAKECGINIGIYGGIITDNYMRTNIKDIFAVGDCIEHRDFFTNKESKLMLASTAASEARVAGMNLFGLRIIRQTKGSIAIFSTSLDEVSMGAAGLTEKQAKAEGFKIIIGQNNGVDHHPTSLPNTSSQIVKLIFSEGSGVILGAQIIGGDSTGEMINMLGLAIQKNMTASELALMQYGTQPKLTAGPTAYPIAVAAMKAVDKMY
ncbi:FAD-dependent oxidoreductase [Ancylomarina sp. 16SWW S1-10-2]|uniref:FAD-dependent oxidoreductase n=1 Tax=Ancylomarina sp. 16SWW S1-10-2 TaxID=2499681 RepID=UPI0012ADBF91|nr:FAD-dependent oxidoreductase [Ancylomarina sp. 16SWW S1-10-2]MRT92599.1 pyridine nucleotide-disulfide oxidoreductase [Ancylomarina sp. 16SWW S1-10-2]